MVVITGENNMKSTEELLQDINQFDFRLIRQTKARKKSDGGLSITHLQPDYTRQRKEINRFETFAENNWTVQEIEFAASFHPAGTFIPHEDADARITRTKIDNTDDECFVEKRGITKVNYAGFGFATWEEAKAFNEAMHRLQRDALMLLGACAALELYGLTFRLGIIKSKNGPNNISVSDATIAQLRHEVVKIVKARKR